MALHLPHRAAALPTAAVATMVGAVVMSVVAALLCLAWMLEPSAEPGIGLLAIPVLAIAALVVARRVERREPWTGRAALGLGDAVRTFSVVALLLAGPTALLHVVDDDSASSGTAWTDTNGAARDIGAACPAGQVVAGGLTDVDPLSGHGGSIACAVWWDVVEPVTPETFQPDAPVTRGAAASVLAALATAVEAPLQPVGAGEFDDIARSPHQASINRLATAGVMSGTAERVFTPDGPLTRAEALVLIVRVLERSAGEGRLPVDPGTVDGVTPDQSEAISTAAALGVIADDEPLRPADVVTRAELSTMVARSLSAAVEADAAQPPIPED